MKSIEVHLDTQGYARLRIGVGGQNSGELAEYVLGGFTSEEQRKLPDIVDHAVGAIELWISQGIETAMQEVNRRN